MSKSKKYEKQIKRLIEQNEILMTLLSTMTEQQELMMKELTILTGKPIKSVKNNKKKSQKMIASPELKAAYDEAKKRSLAKNDGASDAELWRRAGLSIRMKNAYQKPAEPELNDELEDELDDEDYSDELDDNGYDEEVQKWINIFFNMAMPITDAYARELVDAGRFVKDWQDELTQVYTMPVSNQADRKTRKAARDMLIGFIAENKHPDKDISLLVAGEVI